jgi:DNA-binding response OmpR family regulator
MTDDQNKKTNIMVVDDTIANLKLLDGILSRRGYRVRSFPRTRMALAAAAVEPPDLILLDINIPEMNGYEMCTRLKADPALAPIPVIFISALNEMLDKVKAFGCGGVDYIGKPFQIEEILARVENHLNLRRLQKELELHNARLDELVRLKTRELADANERLSILDKAKNDFLMLISHELRTPLHGLFGVAELLFATYPVNSANSELIDIFQQSQERLLRIIEDALLLTQMDVDAGHFSPEAVPLSPMLEQAVNQTAGLAASRKVGLPSVPGNLPVVSGDDKLFQKAMHALLETAVKFSNAGQGIVLSCASEADGVVVVVESLGQCVADDVFPGFFQVLATGQAMVPGGDLGLSLPLAQRIISLFGGRITAQNQVPAGLKFTVRFKTVLPVAAAVTL